MHEGSRRAIIAALLANLGIAISKVFAFVLTRSASMLAEAIHSFADTGNQALLILGGRRAKRAPDAAHPFGYGTERYFWAFIVALVLFTLGGLFAIYEGIHTRRHPHELESPIVAVIVLVLAITLESFSLRTAVREATPSRHGRSWRVFIRETRNPELPVVLLEDIGALTGLVLALIGVVLAWTTGAEQWDALGSISIGTLLCIIAVFLAVEMKSLLIGESADPAAEAAVRAAALDGPEARSIIHLRTMHLGPEEILVAAKVEMTSGDLPAVAADIDAIEARIRAAVPEAATIYLEPDLRRPTAID
ncbi:MAG: cation diffusion facilitator family transporter [Actinomycetota bacterium]